MRSEGLAPADDLRRTKAYRYELPPDRIATVPAEPADAARLLVVGGTRREPRFEHRTFRDFPNVLRPSDVLVINETRVVRARLRGTREAGGAAEIFLLRPAHGGIFDLRECEWHALVKPGRRLPVGSHVRFGSEASAEIVDVRADGSRIVRFAAGTDLGALMERYGDVPLPPYVGAGDAARAARYQTIFARVPGSVAAPTASLHFTPRVLEAIAALGTSIAPLVLDVGWGTFQAMEGTSLDEHVMHAERYAISESTAQTINAAKRDGRRVVVAGTTALRALEASAWGAGLVRAGAAETKLFITPGYRFRIADALLTNFHLPLSTLLVLVTAFTGHERTIAAYRSAIEEGYRFFSFGDAMFVTRS